MAFRKKPGRGGTGRSRPSGRRRLEYEEEEEPRGRGRRSQRDESGGGRRSGRGGGGGKGGFDWSVADDDDRDDDDYDDDYDDEPRRDRPRESSRRSSRRRKSKPRKTLMDLCTPVFGHLAILPSKPEDPHPQYGPYRTHIVEALDGILREAPEYGIEAEDANQACYALCFLADTLVGDSAWNGRLDWSGEPLGIVRYQDPEGGVNFFHRLERFGERQRAVKEVYLVCLALGFRGKFAELEPTEQAAKLADVRQQILRDIRPQSFDKLPELFPEAYEPAHSIEDEVPPAPRWWWGASIGVVVFAAVIWGLLFLWAGSSPKDASARVEEQLEILLNEPRPAAVEVDEPDAAASDGATP
jgi:type IV/VI secretion system ImpK/VasF family protein